MFRRTIQGSLLGTYWSKERAAEYEMCSGDFVCTDLCRRQGVPTPSFPMKSGSRLSMPIRRHYLVKTILAQVDGESGGAGAERQYETVPGDHI